jgi:hypothetical protein
VNIALKKARTKVGTQLVPFARPARPECPQAA